ncbi:MAG: depupylase/deamidase Dop [Acidimicrobiales bacterium]
MAVTKIVGIETEFGIMVRGTVDWNPVSASSLLINAYVGTEVGGVDDRAAPIAWDFIDEMPGADARDLMPPEFAMPPEVETHLVNAVLTNGARYYVDHAHPELSTPECRDALSVVLFDRAAELILIESMRAARDALPEGQEIVIYKDNSDRKGNAYGCHENFLLDRNLPFGQIITAATTHFVSRQIFTGSGKVGSELPGVSRSEIPFQLTQRAEHFEEEVGLETTLKRPIVNTRDEPHADSQKYRRLHVIVGDANLSQVATFLKVGTSAIVFAMLEDGDLEQMPIADPVPAMHHVSHDLTLSRPITMADGKAMTALEIQWQLLAQAKAWADRRGMEAVGEECGKLVLERWEEVLSGLESDPASLAGQVDWIAKRRILEGFMERHDCGWDDSRLSALDLQYHDLRPGKSLAARAGLERLVSDEDATVAITEPPSDTRAYFRGRCLQKFADQVVAANWDSIVFDVGDDPLRRVPMLEPSRGTVEHVGTILDESDTVTELLERLGA